MRSVLILQILQSAAEASGTAPDVTAARVPLGRQHCCKHHKLPMQKSPSVPSFLIRSLLRTRRSNGFLYRTSSCAHVLAFFTQQTELMILYSSVYYDKCFNSTYVITYNSRCLIQPGAKFLVFHCINTFFCDYYGISLNLATSNKLQK